MFPRIPKKHQHWHHFPGSINSWTVQPHHLDLYNNMLYNSICKTVNTYFILFWRYYFPAPTGRWGQRSKQVRSRGCRSALGTLRVWPQGAGKCWTNEALNGISDFLDSSFWKSYYILLYIWFYKYTCLLVCIYVCINICKPKPSFHFLCQKIPKEKTWTLLTNASDLTIFICRMRATLGMSP